MIGCCKRYAIAMLFYSQQHCSNDLQMKKSSIKKYIPQESQLAD